MPTRPIRGLNLHVFCPDLLVRAKPRLDDVRPDVRTALVDDLHRIAFLAESLTEQRSRWKKTLPQADELLDREGEVGSLAVLCFRVNICSFASIFPRLGPLTRCNIPGVLLWNTSGIIGKAPDDGDGRAVVAACQFQRSAHTLFVYSWDCLFRC
jgi:hypothetical protein